MFVCTWLCGVSSAVIRCLCRACRRREEWGGGRGPDGAMTPDFYIGVVGMGPDEAMVLDRYLLVWGQGSWWGCDTTSLYGVVHPIRKLVLQDNHGLGGWRYPIQEFHSS